MRQRAQCRKKTVKEWFKREVKKGKSQVNATISNLPFLTLTTHSSDIEACRLLITEFMQQISAMPALLNGVPALFVQEAKMFGFSKPTSIDVGFEKIKKQLPFDFDTMVSMTQSDLLCQNLLIWKFSRTPINRF